MEQLKIRLKSGPPTPHYSSAFKKKIVREFESGFLNKDQLQLKYGIGGNSTILKWCRQYGKFVYPESKATGGPMKDPQKQRIKELEKKLKAAELKLKVYDKLIEITNRELDTDIKKKIEARLSKSWQQKKK